MIKRDIGQSEGLKRLITKIKIAREAISQCEQIVKRFKLDDQKSTVAALKTTVETLETEFIKHKDKHDLETKSKPRKVTRK